MDDSLKAALEGIAKHQSARHKNKYLARLLGVSPASVYHWYKGRNLPKPETLLVIEELSGIRLTHLYEIKSSQKFMCDPVLSQRLKVDLLLNRVAEMSDEKQESLYLLLELIIDINDSALTNDLINLLKHYIDR